MPQNISINPYRHGHASRHAAWLLGDIVQWLAGLALMTVVPALVIWGPQFWQHLDVVRIQTLWAVSVSFASVVLVLQHLSRFSGGDVMAHIAPVVTSVFLLTFAVLIFTRLHYSRPVLFGAYFICLAWCYARFFLVRHYRRLRYAVLPMDPAHHLPPAPHLQMHYLRSPDLQGVRYDAILADLRDPLMTPAWERFLSRCILNNIPVLHVHQVREGLTGRVCIDHLSENEVGALLPSPLYTLGKRVMDVLVVLATLPLTVPLMAATAIAVRLDSPGPALFVQGRVGLGNRDFRIYKFRSMRVDAEAHGARLACTDDDRITRVGRIIRKTRLDELPQLWNVLRGDMSLIGPRPEQRVFVDRFETEIPFYIYRHVVRPGLTGWAQVMQGYTEDDAEATRIKIQHDFYYIKNLSLWLDLLIAFRTVRVLLTGWGAR